MAAVIAAYVRMGACAPGPLWAPGRAREAPEANGRQNRRLSRADCRRGEVGEPAGPSPETDGRGAPLTNYNTLVTVKAARVDSSSL
jgi:hypothetical protein